MGVLDDLAVFGDHGRPEQACGRHTEGVTLHALTSCWEVATLVQKRKLKLATPCRQWIDGAVDDADLPALDALMARYHDRPMDFADATLVHLAWRESLSTIFTIDHDDFGTYRIEGRRPFRMVPDRTVPSP